MTTIREVVSAPGEHYIRLIPPPKDLLPLSPFMTIPSAIFEEVKAIHREVSEAKSSLDQFGPKEGTALARSVHVYDRLKYMNIRNREYTNNGYLKCRELLGIPDLVGDYLVKFLAGTGSKSLRLFANAELPGGFLLAIDDWSTHVGLSLDWIACSLVPSDKAALGDSVGIVSLQESKWLMGKGKPGGKGDLCNKRDIIGMAQAAYPVHLYTSDVGVGLSGNYNEQEKINTRVHFGQAITGIMSLSLGGCMIVKHYTLLLPCNISLVTYLSSLFEKFYVIKPVTSRLANSEVYLVGVGFRGLSTDEKKILLSILDHFEEEKTIVDLGIDIVSDTIRAIIDVGRELNVGRQARILRRISELGELGGVRAVERVVEKYGAESMCQEWIRLYPTGRGKYVKSRSRNHSHGRGRGRGRGEGRSRGRGRGRGHGRGRGRGHGHGHGRGHGRGQK